MTELREVIVERHVRNRIVRAECAPAHARLAASVLDTIERLSESGAELHAGTVIRFGWSALRLDDDGGALRVTEPVFASWPQQRWSPTIDVTLGVLAAQTGLLHRVGVDGEDVYFDQLLVTAKGALVQPGVFLRRVDRLSEEDSGWLLGPLDDPDALAREENLERVRIASLASSRRSLLQALTLPTGFIIVFSGDAIEQIFDADGRERLHSSGAS